MLGKNFPVSGNSQCKSPGQEYAWEREPAVSLSAGAEEQEWKQSERLLRPFKGISAFTLQEDLTTGFFRKEVSFVNMFVLDLCGCNKVTRREAQKPLANY